MKSVNAYSQKKILTAEQSRYFYFSNKKNIFVRFMSQIFLNYLLLYFKLEKNFK